MKDIIFKLQKRIETLELLVAANIKNSPVRITPEGGVSIQLLNKTGAASVKGYLVTPSTVTAEAVVLLLQNIPNPIGVFYESGIPDGSPAWIVIEGIAEAYFIGNTTLGHIARGFVAADGGFVAGQALSEATPGSPFSVDKHFLEIGHVIQARVGAGLAKIVMHFN